MSWIEEAFKEFFREQGLDGDIWLAHKEVPYWGERSSPHDPHDVYEASRRLASMCDGAVLHGLDNGSGALGYFYKALVEAPHHPPVLVVAHETEELSKAWLGQQRRHLNVTFARFSDDEENLDLFNAVRDWCRFLQQDITTGPSRRRDVERVFQPQSRGLTYTWSRLGQEERGRLSHALQMSEADIAMTVSDSMELARLPAADFIRLLQIHDAYRAELVSRAREVFDSGELRAWQTWASRCSRTSALRVLEFAVSEKSRIARWVGDLHQIAGWDSLHQRWKETE